MHLLICKANITFEADIKYMYYEKELFVSNHF